jgi:small subunit ribosomal protein S20
MAHRPAALKSLRQDRKRRLRNKAIKSRLRTEGNKFDRMIQRGELEAAEQQLALLTKLLHRAGSRNIIHPNKAARLQAQCQRALNGAGAETTA